MFKKKEIIEEATFQISNYPKICSELNHMMMKSRQHGSFVMDGLKENGNPIHKQLQFKDLVHSSVPLQNLIKRLAKIETLEKRITRLEKRKK